VTDNDATIDIVSTVPCKLKYRTENMYQVKDPAGPWDDTKWNDLTNTFATSYRHTVTGFSGKLWFKAIAEDNRTAEPVDGGTDATQYPCEVIFAIPDDGEITDD
jgi:hypothetical protein